MTTVNNILKINTALFIKPKKDELYREEISDQNKLIKKLKSELSSAEIERNRLSVLNAESRGVEPAYISSLDLKMIIEDLLENKSPVSKALHRHEVNKGMCTGWAAGV